MRQGRRPLVSCLLMVLVAFQLLAGVPLCREWGADLGDRAGDAAAAQASAPHEEGGAHGHHDHPAERHPECPEAFLPAAPQGAAAAIASGRVAPAPPRRIPLPTYEVPTPVPILRSVCAQYPTA